MSADTQLGGRPGSFPSTCWSRFLGGELREAAVAELAKSYWKPIYACIRASWAKSVEDAKDLTQDFFVWMMETDFLARADPARGRFRSYVRVALKHYLTSDARRTRSLKRGGGQGAVGLEDVMNDAAGVGVPDPKGRSPEEILDEAWKAELFSRADRMLQEKFRGAGKDLHYRAWRDYYFAAGDEPEYRDLAARHGITEAEVLQALRQARESFRAIVTSLVAETVGGTAELEDELRILFGRERS